MFDRSGGQGTVEQAFGRLRAGRVKFIQLNARPIRSPHHRQGGPDIPEPGQFPDQGPFDFRFALELQDRFYEERLGGFEIVDHDEDLVHSFSRHISPSPTSLLWRVLAARGAKLPLQQPVLHDPSVR